MGNLRAAFETVPYAIAVMCICLFIGTALDIMPTFGTLFSFSGLIAFAFVMFGLTAK
jgi:hypothetical protein